MASSAQSKRSLQRIQRASIKDQALGQLKEFILSGEIGADRRLPSERELAERLGVGRNSVREALKALELVGLVEARVGEGTFVTAPTEIGIGRAIGWGLAVWGDALVGIMNARQIIEAGSARAAAQNATDDDLHQLAGELEKMKAADGFEAYLAADMNFHRLVAQATHNGIVAQITGNLLDLLEEAVLESGSDKLKITSEGSSTHQVVYEAIQSRDAEGAERAMRQHLDYSMELWKTLISVGSAVRRV